MNKNGKEAIRSLVVRRWLVIGVDGQHVRDGMVTRLLQLLPLAVLPRVQPLAIRRVDGLRRGRPEGDRKQSVASSPQHDFFAKSILRI